VTGTAPADAAWAGIIISRLAIGRLRLRSPESQGLVCSTISTWASLHRAGGFVSQKGRASRKSAAANVRIIETSMIEIRRGSRDDLDAIARIQASCPDAAQWAPADYLDHDLRVALLDNRVAGFLVTRLLGTLDGNSECEILNLAVAAQARRRGIARRLIGDFLTGFSGSVFLEVRESNNDARSLYNSMKFMEIDRRPEYYLSPTEAAIVMKFHSC